MSLVVRTACNVLTLAGNRAADINMMAVFNSQERDETEWVELFRKASPRFELEEVRRAEGAMLDIIVFRWK